MTDFLHRLLTLERLVETLLRRIAALEARLAALEQQAGQRWRQQ